MFWQGFPDLVVSRKEIFNMYTAVPCLKQHTSLGWVIAVWVVHMCSTVWHSTARSRTLDQGTALWKLGISWAP